MSLTLQWRHGTPLSSAVNGVQELHHCPLNLDYSVDADAMSAFRAASRQRMKQLPQVLSKKCHINTKYTTSNALLKGPLLESH